MPTSKTTTHLLNQVDRLSLSTNGSCCHIRLWWCWITNPLHHCKVRSFPSAYQAHTAKLKHADDHLHYYSFLLSLQNTADDSSLLITLCLSMHAAHRFTLGILNPQLQLAADQPSNGVSIDLARYPPLLSACKYFQHRLWGFGLWCCWYKTASAWSSERGWNYTCLYSDSHRRLFIHSRTHPAKYK